MNAVNLKFRSKDALSIVQFETENKNSFEYISLSKAIQGKFIEVMEVSESGSVNDLNVINNSQYFVFMSDGDILSGAKQNRVLNTSVLIAPKSKTKIPVSCVEHGRWRYSSDKFSETDYTAPAYMRSGKAKDVNESLKVEKSHNAKQEKVWEEVELYHRGYGSKSETSNLSDIFDMKKNDFDKFINEFKIENESNGVAIFINNKLLNIEIFNRTDVYKDYFNKLLKGAYFEAYLMKPKDNKLTEAEAIYKTTDFLDKTESLNFESHNGVGAGTERRFETEDMTGFELDYENSLIHFAGLNVK
ncbi:MAG TPA: hypothetical protein PKD83_05200 [Ignavibacteria bacterium]|nr:hypothetical protein [Ignavibacteria bacterium]